MASIEQVTDTVTQEIFILKYTRAELEDFAAKPQRYLNDILSVLNGSNAAPPPVSKAKRGEAGRGVKKVDQFKTYPCKICKRAFKKPGYLAQHMRKAHDGETEIGTYKPDKED